VIAAAGDIACDPADAAFNGGLGDPRGCRQAATARAIAAVSPAAVLALGDNQYNAATLAGFRLSYGPTWGRFNPIVYPVPGNHEYVTPGATGYFGYYGPRAGARGVGYYSFDIGAWHLIALNSNCERVACGPASAQLRWLRADLAAHPNVCTLAFFHHPLFSSGHGFGDEPVRPFWQALYAGGADVVLNGHSHNYERFAPQTPAGAPDPVHGVREFVVGTGGENLQGFIRAMAQSQVRTATTYGVLVMTLRPTSYDWRFVPAAGAPFTDAGSGACH
jgi:hypothetical protein